MAKLTNLARVTSATTGTGTLTLGVAVSGFLSFATAGVQNNDIVFYGIKDGGNSEVGWGTYTSAGTTLSRNVIKSTNGNAPIGCSGSQEVYITALAGDGGDLLPGFTNPMRGFDLPINLQLNASVASNILTVAVKGNNGSDPSNSNPVLIPFRDATVANGGPVWVAITSALSINTNAVGASLGAGSSSTPFRFWVVLFNNGGTPVLGLINCVTIGTGTPVMGGGILALDETSVQSTTAMSASATSAGVFYTPNGTPLTNCPFRILGYVEYASGLTTAGSYASAPTKVQLFGPGIPRPGQPTGNYKYFATTSTTTSSTGAYVATVLHTSMTLASAANAVEIFWTGPADANDNGDEPVLSLFRGNNAVTTQLGVASSVGFNHGTTNGIFGAVCGLHLDTPFAGATTAAAYTVGMWTAGVTSIFPFNAGLTLGAGGSLTLKEIMG